MVKIGISPQIDSCKYIYMASISETDEEHLTVVVREARVFSDEETAEANTPSPIAGANIIGVDEKSRVFQLVWKRYVGYVVRNDSYAPMLESEIIESGIILRKYSSSKFLDYIAETTFASIYFPDGLIHIRVPCLDHIIDVISPDLPIISLLSGEPPLRSVAGEGRDD